MGLCAGQHNLAPSCEGSQMTSSASLSFKEPAKSVLNALSVLLQAIRYQVPLYDLLCLLFKIACHSIRFTISQLRVKNRAHLGWLLCTHRRSYRYITESTGRYSAYTRDGTAGCQHTACAQILLQSLRWWHGDGPRDIRHTGRMPYGTTCHRY